MQTTEFKRRAFYEHGTRFANTIFSNENLGLSRETEEADGILEPAIRG